MEKYHDSRETYALIREVSDTLCEEYGLSVVKDKKLRKLTMIIIIKVMLKRQITIHLLNKI